MSDFSSRLKFLRKSRGISQSEFAKMINLSKSSVNMYERGEREPGFETLEAIADFFNVSIDYLLGRSDFLDKSACFENLSDNDTANRLRELRAKRNMTLEQVAQQVGVGRSTVRKWETGIIENMRCDRIAKLATALRTTPGYLMGWEDGPESEYPANIIPMPKMSKIPLYGAIDCRNPILTQQDPNNMVDLPSHIHADFALICKGDTMINARIFDGDVVYIRRQESVENGEIAAVLIDEEATLKRVRLFNDHIVLEPENPQYRPFSYWGEDMNSVHILGKAVAFTSSVL